MLGPNWIPPADKDGMGDDVSWRDDPSVRQWPRPTPAARLRLGPSATGDQNSVVGLSDDHVVLVLVDGTPTLLPLSRAQALAMGHTVLDADDDVLAAAGVVVRDVEPWPEIPPITDEPNPEPVPAEVELFHRVDEVPVALPQRGLDTAEHWEPVTKVRWWADEPPTPLTQAPEPAQESEPARPTSVVPDDASPSVRLLASGVVKRLRSPDGPLTVLDGLDLGVHAGECVVVTGTAGSGTSTLLNCLAGLDDVDEGDVIVDGQRWSEESDSDRARHRCASIGFAGQENDLVEQFTAAENVEVPLLCAGWRRQEARAAAMAMLGRFDLGDHAEFTPDQLSTSSRHCVVLARALVGDPLMVVLDQPTAHLDDTQTEHLVSCLTDLQCRQSAILVATRDSRITAVASRVFILQEGRLRSPTS